MADYLYDDMLIIVFACGTWGSLHDFTQRSKEPLTESATQYPVKPDAMDSRMTILPITTDNQTKCDNPHQEEIQKERITLTDSSDEERLVNHTSKNNDRNALQ